MVTSRSPPTPARRPPSWTQVRAWNRVQCRNCHRPLTDPVSRARGTGPRCAQKGRSRS
ncbi:DUF6011 domain-containing protein [Nocardiopsis synnemataformans]|uniref:DUF6011 domain-containing protein n=1 Tax=Nocardiopsis synnemataformans TaxID=61305 RepID=UPI003EB76ADE